MRFAGLMLAVLVFAPGGVAPVLAQQPVKTIPIPSEAAPPASAGARAILYEEDPDDPNGRSFAGSVAWRGETIKPNVGATELVIIAEAEIPQRMRMTLTLRHNTDRSLPASHTIDLLFKLPSEAPPGAILNVPGILMKQSENAPGALLAGLAVKVTTGFFLIGLSEAPRDRDRNVALLKERPWLEIPIVFVGQRRAILALEKGASGDEAFAQTFAEWEK